MASQRRCDRAREGVAIVSEGVAVPERVWQGKRSCGSNRDGVAGPEKK